MMRVICTSIGSALLHFSYKYLPLSIVSTLYSLNPIFIYFIEAAYFKVYYSIDRNPSTG